MKIILLAASVILLCSITACNKGDLPGPGSSSIVGKWRWIKSVGGIGGFTVTPQSSGYNIRNEFYADSSFKRFQNNVLQISGNFRTTPNYQYSPTEKADILLISGPTLDTRPVSYLIRHDTLYLNEIYIADGYNEVYVRMK